MKKNIIAIAISLLIANLTYAQDPVKLNFYEYINYLYEHDSSLSLPDSLKSGSAKDIDRAARLWGPRLNPKGQFPDAASSIIEYSINYNLTGNNCYYSAQWDEEGPFGKIGYGAGQINRITFDPNYNGTSNRRVYAGSFHGGLWKSENSGQSWSILNTDLELAQTSVSGIAVSYQDSNNIFICTGDGDMRDFEKIKHYASPRNYGTAPNYTTGIYRSTDFGQSWQSINNGFISHFMAGGAARFIEINPLNENVVFCATTNGLFRTTNALGLTPIWNKLNVPDSNTNGEDFRVIKYHPTDTNILYTASKDVYRSNNGGDSWVSMTGSSLGLDLNNLPDSFYVRRINLAVTPADSSRLYAYINGMDKSYNNSWQQAVYIYVFKNGAWSQIDYFNDRGDLFLNLPVTWMGFAVSPVDVNKVYYGHTEVRGTIDLENNSFKRQAHYWGAGFHADVHSLVFEPNVTNPKLFCGNHGGVSMKNTNTDGLGGWQFRSAGINSNLIWAFDISNFDPEVRVMGRQDNACERRIKAGNNYIWQRIRSGDGYAAQITHDVSNPKFLFSNSGYSNFALPVDAYHVAHSPNFDPDLNEGKEWLPFAFQVIEHPVDRRSIFGFSELYSLNGSTVPQTLSSNTDWLIESDLYRYWPWRGHRRIREIAISPSDTNYVYLVTHGHDFPVKSTLLHRSTSGLRNGNYDSLHWTYPPPPAGKFDDITNHLPLTVLMGDTVAPFITGIAVSDKNPLKIWVSLSGFNDTLKVLRSDNGGNTWISEDPTHSLPNMPANNIVLQGGSNNRLYLATDVGVFVKDDTMSCWKRFGNIPNVKVLELKINRCNQKLYASTYGRGIWSVDLIDSKLGEMKIDTDVIWEKDLFIESNIVVKENATLTVKGKLYMPKDAKITVETGGALMIDGGHITNSCETFWQGIELKGYDSLPQHSASYGQIYQPYLLIENGGEISNARVAVRSGLTDDNGDFVGGTAGGMIVGLDATFKNNLKDIIMHPYQNYIAGTSPKTLLKDVSRFTNCSFISDTPLPNNLITAEHINIDGIDGLNIEGCTLKNELAQSNLADRGTAIRAVNSSYEVIPDGSTRTLIEGFFIGVDNYASNPMYTPTIKKTDFIDNVKGALIAGSDYATVVQNKFEILDASAGDQPYGLYLNWSSGYEVEENNFTYTGGGTANNAVGLVVMNSNNNSNEIYHNNFDYLHTATLVHGDNKIDGTNDGLKIKCNDYDADGFHIALESISMGPFGGYLHPEIALNQGGNASQTDPAGNTFNDLCNSGGVSDIFISTNGSSINYFHHSDAITTPLCSTASKVTNMITSYSYNNRDESCPSHISSGGGGGIDPGLGLVSHAGNDFNEALKAQLSNKSSEVEALELNDYVRLKLLQDTIEFDSVILALAASGTSNNQIRMIAAIVRKGDTSFNDKSVQRLLSKEALSYIAFSNDLKNGGKHYEEAKKSMSNAYFMWAKVREYQLSGEKVPSAYQLPQKRIRIEDENKPESSILIYPNPTDEQLTIELAGFSENDKIRLDILDVKGSLISTKALSANNQKNKLSVASLKNGVYLINIYKNGKLFKSKRLSIQH